MSALVFRTFAIIYLIQQYYLSNTTIR